MFALVEWSRGHEFLDKELESMYREASVGRGTVDKLVQVWLRDGTEQRILIHIEVQSQVTSDFAERMYTYNHRL